MPNRSTQADAEACEIPNYHLVERVQSHAVLLAADVETGRLSHASANADRLFGVAATAMLGTPLTDWMEIDADYLRPETAMPVDVRLRRGLTQRHDAWIYLGGGALCLEMQIDGAVATPDVQRRDAFDFIAMCDVIAHAELPTRTQSR